MKDYYIVDTLPVNETFIIERINFCHIPLIYVHDTIPILAKDSLNPQGRIELNKKEKMYVLLKKSGKKNGGILVFTIIIWMNTLHFVQRYRAMRNHTTLFMKSMIEGK